MSGKSKILSRLSGRLFDSQEVRQAAVSKYLKSNRRGIIPARTQVAQNDLISLFISEAERADASCQRLSSLSEVPKAVEDYITRHELATHICLSEQAEIRHLNWQSCDLQLLDGDERDGVVGVNKAYGGVAETGSLAFVSSGDLRLSQNFLSATHVAILSERDIVGCYEDIRERLGNDFAKHRGFTFVTGPSRTGDIAQTLELGAHGALRLHILVFS